MASMNYFIDKISEIRKENLTSNTSQLFSPTVVDLVLFVSQRLTINIIMYVNKTTYL